MSYDSIHRQTPIPDEPRTRKKAVKQRDRSDHKHEYELVAIDSHSYEYLGRGKVRQVYNVGERCRICGRLGNVYFRNAYSTEGMRLFEVDDWRELMERYLPEDKEVKR